MAWQPSRYRFRLRTLLIAITVLAVTFAWCRWEVEQVRKEQAILAWSGKLGAGIGYPEEIPFFSKDNWFGARVTFVEFVGSEVSDVSPLAELKNLEHLELWGTQVSDLSALSGLNELKTLRITGSPVSDLSPLAELKSLERLDLSGTQVSDLASLVELKNLKEVCIADTQVNDEQVQKLKQAIPNANISLTINTSF
jgi:Leucine-rich repeat (LRR) protein